MPLIELLKADGLGKLVSDFPSSTGVAVIFAAAFVIAFLVSRPKRLDFPVMGKPGSSSYADAVAEGVEKYPDTPFVIPLPKPMVILPSKVIDEVRNLPENQVSFRVMLAQDFMEEYTKIGQDAPELLQAVRSELTRHIAATLDGLQDEIRYSFNKELGPCDDWKPVVLYGAMARVVALLSGRVFVGRPLSRNEEWLDASINYAGDAINARNAIAEWPPYMRKIVVPFLPAVKRLNMYGARGAELLAPILKSTLEKYRNEKKSLDDDDEQGTFISWMLKHTPAEKRDDPARLAASQMSLAFAAIHTTTMAVSQVIYDLVVRPEYIQALREEIQRVIDEDGQDTDGDGFLKLKKTSMPKLKMLDSFLKESQRMNPPVVVTNLRITTAPLTLSTGHTLPANTRIAFPSYSVHTSVKTLTFSPSYNPAVNKPPTEFDGFRFYNLRAMKGKESRHQFVTSSADSLSFGYGNHACPGRFFASNEIKVVLIELLRSWDIRLKGDVEMKGGVDKRPKDFFNEFSVVPNMEAELEFKRRKE